MSHHPSPLASKYLRFAWSMGNTIWNHQDFSLWNWRNRGPKDEGVCQSYKGNSRVWIQVSWLPDHCFILIPITIALGRRFSFFLHFHPQFFYFWLLAWISLQYTTSYLQVDVKFVGNSILVFSKFLCQRSFEIWNWVTVVSMSSVSSIFYIY